MARKPGQETSRSKRRKERSKIEGNILEFMKKEKPGLYGTSNKDVVNYIRTKLHLNEISKSRIREALCNLVVKGQIKRARINSCRGTLDEANYEEGVIYYLTGVSDDQFPPEFREFLEVNRNLAGVA